MPSWSFETGNPPFIESKNPSPGVSGVAQNTLVSFDIIDAESFVRIVDLDAYVDGSDAYRQGIGFVAPFDGPSSTITFLSGGSIDGYDAYRVVIDNTGLYSLGSTVTARCVIDDYGYNQLDESWIFDISFVIAPFLRNRVPIPGSSGVSATTIISFDLLDQNSDLRQDTLMVYVEGNLAYNGATFVSPYNGPGSSSAPTIVDGYDGYHIEVDSYNNYFGLVPVTVTASDSCGNALNQSWAFIVGTNVNVVYFSDGYGLKAVDIDEFVGESQDVVRTVASTAVVPTIPHDSITDVFGEWIRSSHHLVLSYDQYGHDGYDAYDGYGAVILTAETIVNQYMDGYRTQDGQLNERGILYIINKNQNQVEVYYGADFRDGYGRTPDYYYSTTSIPAIFPGEITCLHVESNASSVLTGGTRLYIGTTLGFTRVDTYDRDSYDGYSDGMDAYGISNTYSIAGGGATHEAIGGTVVRVGALASDEEKSIIFVATNDGYGNGGLTQITINGNSKIIFMTKENAMLPSNDIRDIFGKEI